MSEREAVPFWDKLPARWRFACVGAMASLVLFPLGWVACCGHRSEPAAPNAASAPSSDGPVWREPRVRFEADAPLEAPWSEDSVWRSALDGDPLDLGRLAEQEGALSLANVVKRGGRAGYVALASFALARDARDYLGELCPLLESAPEDTARILQTVHAVALRPSPGETLDASGVQRCVLELQDKIRAQAFTAPAHDLAVSAVHLLEPGR